MLGSGWFGEPYKRGLADDRLRALGPVFGAILCIIMAVQGWYLLFLDLVAPASEIDKVMRRWDDAVFRDTVQKERECS